MPNPNPVKAPPAPLPAHVPVSQPAVRQSPQTDELIIEIYGRDSNVSLTLRPMDTDRLRGRYGRGPGFEQWVADRIRDFAISFGGG